MADITDITSGNLEGTGYFDQFMQAIDQHLHRELSKGRIQSTDYANVYLGAMQTALAQAVAYVQVVEQVRASTERTTAEVALLNQKYKTEQAQILDTVDGNTVVGAIGKQKAVQQAQAEGFLRDAEQKATKVILDAWGIAKSVEGIGFDLPDGALNEDISDMIIKLREGIGITESIYSSLSANAGADKDIVAGTAYVVLDGTNSVAPVAFDASGNEIPNTINSWLWEHVGGGAGPGTITINNHTTSIANFTAPALDTVTPANNIYTFRLTVTDTVGNPAATDTVVYTVV